MARMSATRDLARFVAQTTYSDLPARLVEQARVYVLDNLAAGLLASVQPWSAMVVDTLRELGGAPRRPRSCSSRGEVTSRARRWPLG